MLISRRRGGRLSRAAARSAAFGRRHLPRCPRVTAQMTHCCGKMALLVGATPGILTARRSQSTRSEPPGPKLGSARLVMSSGEAVRSILPAPGGQQTSGDQHRSREEFPGCERRRPGCQFDGNFGGRPLQRRQDHRRRALDCEPSLFPLGFGSEPAGSLHSQKAPPDLTATEPTDNLEAL